MGSVGSTTANKSANWQDNITFESKNSFFGDIHKTTNKYFQMKTQVIDDDNIIIFTSNVTSVKGNPVLIINDNHAVYLKDWQIAGANIKDSNGSVFDAYAVKLNRNYFKPYTFKSNFGDMMFEKPETFDSLKDIAKLQGSKGNQISPKKVIIHKDWIEKI